MKTSDTLASLSGGQTDRPIPDKTVASVLGQIVWLMSQSDRHKNLFITDLEWLVMPAIILKQFKLYHKNDLPVGLIIWASVSEVVAKRMTEPNMRLQMQDWLSGPEVRIVDVIAPFGGADEIQKEFLENLKTESKNSPKS